MGAPLSYGRPQYQSNTLQFRPDSFMGGQRIDARPRNVAYDPMTGPGTGRTAQRQMGSFGGLNNYYALQDRNRPAFADPRGIHGMGNSAEERSRNLTNQGLMFNPHAGGYVPDTLYNRTSGYQNPYFGGDAQGAPSLTEPQQRWANKAQEKMSGVGALGKIGEKMSSINPAMGQLGWLSKIAGAASNVMGGAPTLGQNPYSGSREQNIANAKAAGEFDAVRNKYNAANKGGSLSMDENGTIVQDPAAFAKIKGEERALQRGSFVTPQTLSKEDEAAGVKSRVAMENPYGRGSFTRYADSSKKPPSMVTNEFGKVVPMNQYLKEKKEVQKSKGMI